MYSHLRVVALATVGLLTMAVVHSWAGSPVAIHGETLLTAPAQLQQAQLQHAQLRSLAGSGLRVAVGF